MIGVKDRAGRVSMAIAAAVVGLGGASVSAVAAGDGTAADTCTDTTTTAPDPSVKPCPADPAETTTTTTETPPPTTPPTTTPAAPETPPAQTISSTAPPPAPAAIAPARTQRQRLVKPHKTVRTTATHRDRPHHRAASHRKRHRHHAGADSARGAGHTVYLRSHMPDPTPPAARVDADFMRMLRATAHHAGVDWALVLAVLRAHGHQDSRPARAATVRALARQLAAHGGGDGRLATAAAATTDGADSRARALALARYYRGVGPTALVEGLEAAKPLLMHRVLTRPGIDIYPGGQVDVMSGRVNVRVLAAILYLRQTFHQVGVSCLITGHRLYARPGVISAHIYGLAADISELGGVSITGHQQSGGVTDHAVQDLLRLPVLPKQIISLLDLGGPSFALSNHWDHIHVGY
jgi:hypothetical protein